MKRKRHTTEQIIRILREADGGKGTEEVCGEHNISAQTCYRWESKYGGLEPHEAQRLRDMEKEPSAAR